MGRKLFTHSATPYVHKNFKLTINGIASWKMYLFKPLLIYSFFKKEILFNEIAERYVKIFI